MISEAGLEMIVDELIKNNSLKALDVIIYYLLFILSLVF